MATMAIISPTPKEDEREAREFLADLVSNPVNYLQFQIKRCASASISKQQDYQDSLLTTASDKG